MATEGLLERERTRSIIGAFYDVYNAMGFGLLENLYAEGLAIELRDRGHEVIRELAVDVHYKGHLLGRQRIDMVVDGKVVVETKATMELHKAASRQCFSYLRASGVAIGLVLHFGPEPNVKRLMSRRYPMRSAGLVKSS